MRITERRLRRIIRRMIHEFIERDDDSQYGEVPEDWSGNDYSQGGFIKEPQNLVQKIIIDSAISMCKSYCEKNNVKSIEDLPKVSRSTQSNIPYILPDLKSRKMSDYTHSLFDQGFVRVAIKVSGYREDTGEHRDKLYEVHLYLNPETRKCIHPKVKIQGWARPKATVGYKS